MRCTIAAASRRFDDLARCGQAEPSGATLVSVLRDSGLLAASQTLAHHPSDPLQLMDALVCVGRADLSAGRLFEGHVNAVKLLHLHGGPLDAVEQGLLHGIWGADGPDPVRLEDGILTGQKLFASGADVIDRVIVTARSDAGLHLLMFRRDQRIRRDQGVQNGGSARIIRGLAITMPHPAYRRCRRKNGTGGTQLLLPDLGNPVCGPRP